MISIYKCVYKCNFVGGPIVYKREIKKSISVEYPMHLNQKFCVITVMFKI